MKSRIITFLLLFVAICGYSKTPAYPYGYRPVHPSDLIPFSKIQLDEYKSNGIKTIELVGTAAESKKKWFTHYALNKNGQVDLETIGYYIKGKEKIIETIKFNYGQFGLVSRVQKDKWRVLKDSLEYDKHGIMIYWLQTSAYFKRKSITSIDTFINLSFIKYENELVVLKDANWFTDSYWKKNQWIKSIGSSRVDSMSVTDSANFQVKIIWYKLRKKNEDLNSKQYSKGLVRIFGKNGLTEQIIFDTSLKSTYYKSSYEYHTNESGQIIHKKDKRADLFYIYNNKGLIEREVAVSRLENGGVHTSQYKYTKW